jgi:hypothetical protein
MTDNLQEKMSADGQSEIMDPVTPEGGEAKQSPTGADTKKNVGGKSTSVRDGVTKTTRKPEVVVEEEDEDDDDEDEDENEMEESFDISSLFEGLDLSENFKERASLVFEAAVNEAAAEKAMSLAGDIQEELQEEFETALSESLDEIVENLDGYLDYVINEWMESNEVAIESGIKVEMAESLMESLKDVFYSHNIKIDEGTIDVVAELEEELKEVRQVANKAINESLNLELELQEVQAERIFEGMTQGLSAQQAERFRVLSEKLDRNNLNTFEDDLNTLRESFFKPTKSNVIKEDLDSEGDEYIAEETAPKRTSLYDSVNAYAQALNTIK